MTVIAILAVLYIALFFAWIFVWWEIKRTQKLYKKLLEEYEKDYSDITDEAYKKLVEIYFIQNRIDNILNKSL